MRKYLTRAYARLKIILDFSANEMKKLADISSEIGTLTVIAAVIPVTRNDFSILKATAGIICALLFWAISLVLIRKNIKE